LTALSFQGQRTIRGIDFSITEHYRQIMTTFVKPTMRAAGFAAAGVTLGYGACRYYNTTNLWFPIAHAESPPSDAKAALKKVPWKGFTELKLESAEMVNHNVKRLTFALPDDESITGLSPVTSLLTQHIPEGAWIPIPVFRPYTPVSSNEEPGHVTFMIKRYPGGKGSNKMHSLVPGDSMKFKPLQELEYKANEYSHMTFIAGGSGITPIYQLTQAILRNPEDKTRISLIYANNTEEDILLKHEFDGLERKFPGRFQKLYTVSKTTSEGEGVYEKGYITKEMLRKVMPNKMNEMNVKVLVSGPPAMTESIAGAKGGFGWTQGSLGGILKELGYNKEEVHKF
jgi:cytochrome-b5 reductase